MSAKARPRKPRFAAANRLPSTAQARLRLDRVSKTFGAVEALRAVDLEIRQGEVTALVGDNGAGKSTLMKIVAGAERADSGRMFLDGRELQIRSPHDAADAGIQTVFQDLALCENLDVTANLFLGREWTRGGIARLLPPPLRPLDSAAMEAQAIEAIRKLDVKTLSSPQIKVGLLSGGQRQAVAIARAVRAESTVVLLDEPTAALGVAQTAQVLALVRQLAENNHAVLYVSHNLGDVFAVADRIAVLRHGALVGARATRATTPDKIVAAITRGEISDDG